MDEKNEFDQALMGKSEFLIRILYKENFTWQGEVHWLNGDKKEYFRSLLELLNLMQEVAETGTRFRSLKDRVEEVS